MNEQIHYIDAFPGADTVSIGHEVWAWEDFVEIPRTHLVIFMEIANLVDIKVIDVTEEYSYDTGR